MTTAITINNGADRVLEVLVSGNLSVLTPPERLEYYNRVCDSLGLNPMTQPFAFITLNGKLTLYALKGCSDQLRKIHGVSLRIDVQQQAGDLYMVTATAVDANGREDSDMGVVATKGLSGEALANAMLKAVTKAKRRVTLSICGLGMLDETEIADIPASAKGARQPVVMPQARIAAPTVDTETGEILDAPEPSAEPPASAKVLADFREAIEKLGFSEAKALTFAEWDQLDGHTGAELRSLYASLKAAATPERALL